VEGYSFWTFSDIFEEDDFPSMAFHGGFGLLNLHGIPKPTYRAFELLHKIGREQLLVDGLHETVDCSVIRNGSALTILITNHTTPGHSIETEQINLRLENASQPYEAHIQRIDREHANPKRLWQEMGQPEYLTENDVEQLQKESLLVRKRQPLTYADGTISLRAKIPPHAVAAITIEFATEKKAKLSK
jgi:xylan 1,4-beta-xylosidase